MASYFFEQCRPSEEESRLALYVVPAEEDLMIARHVARMCGVSLPSEA